jgi:hypothetical protein
MIRLSHRSRCKVRNMAGVTWILAYAMVGGGSLSAQTYVSVEPIPSQDIVGAADLNAILGIGYANLELWSQRLLNDCHIVQNVINTLSADGAIHSVNPGNTVYLVAAGGFEGVTDPTYVLTISDSGTGAASATDIWVLDNALGYALNQGGTAQFGLVYNNKNPFEFALDYAIVSNGGSLSGEQAQSLFNYLGTIDRALWSGTNAGFTQINASASPVTNYLLDNSMLFLIGAVSKQEFTQGLFAAATTSPNMTYSPLGNNGKPTSAKAGAAFPGNDWITYPNGDGYLMNLGTSSPQLLNDLAALRQQHLNAVNNLLDAINKGNVSKYLNNQFKCP